jgi:very-short-patch-repair endonuclease/ssDNA-binding Zn-finger/Zn-ribbon topoisomerase 1
MPAKLSLKEIDERLNALSFIRLGDYNGNNLMLIKHSICGGEWNTRLSSVFRGAECPTCIKIQAISTFDTICQSKNIKRIGEYISTGTTVLMQCQDCFHKWEPIAESVLYTETKGCPQCNGNMRLNNKKVDQELDTLNIIRVDDYINALTPISFRCGLCSLVWKTAPSNILNNDSGCPKCSHVLKLTNDIIDQRLVGRNIIRVGDCNGSKSKIDFKCNICEYIWSATISNIINNLRGCPKCAGKEKLSNLLLDDLLKEKNIASIGQYINNSTPIEFRCLINDCNHIWLAKPAGLVQDRSGCPKCSNRMKLSLHDIEQRLVGRNIRIIGKYENTHTPTMLLCLNDKCEYKWKASLTSILHSHTGCPKCSIGKNQLLIFNILKDNDIIFEDEKFIKDIAYVDNLFHVDFYLPQHNTIIEYNGRQHYMPVNFGGIEWERAENNFKRQQERDRFIEEFCNLNKINLIWIDGRTYVSMALQDLIVNEIIPSLTKSL